MTPDDLFNLARLIWPGEAPFQTALARLLKLGPHGQGRVGEWLNGRRPIPAGVQDEVLDYAARAALGIILRAVDEAARHSDIAWRARGGSGDKPRRETLTLAVYRAGDRLKPSSGLTPATHARLTDRCASALRARGIDVELRGITAAGYDRWRGDRADTKDARAEFVTLSYRLGLKLGTDALGWALVEIDHDVIARGEISA